MRSLHLPLVSTCFVLAGLSSAPAQTATGSISGVVTDSLGAALPKANVALHSKDNRTARQAATDASGHFVISDLAPGHYEIEADAKGFAVADRPDVNLNAGQTLDLTFPLRISDLNEQVTVEADASNSEAAQLAPMDSRLDARSARTEIMDHYIQNYTAPTADYTEMIHLAPGTFSINSNGSRARGFQGILPRLFRWQLRHHLRRHSV